MSSKIKTVVFSVCSWTEKRPFELYNEWRKRVDAFIKYDNIFLSPGTYSDPSLLKADIDIVQTDTPLTKPYDRDWSYYRVGFMSGIYNLLLNIKDFDVAIHVQSSVLLNLDLNQIIEEFMSRQEILAAPKFTSNMGCYIETGLMMLKKEAVFKYANSNLRPSLSDKSQMNVEEEALYMFDNQWWNFIPEIVTIRKKDTTVLEDAPSPFNLSSEEFYELPMIMVSHYVSKEELNKWIELNPI